MSVFNKSSFETCNKRGNCDTYIRKQPKQTAFEGAQTLAFVDTYFKAAIVNILEELMETILKGRIGDNIS